MSDHCDKGRRRFVKLSAIGVAVTPLVGRVSLAAERLEEDDPVAQALFYRHNAADASDHALFQEDRYCYNCVLYDGPEDAEWAPCSAVGNKLVAREGWCSVWVPRS